MTSRLQRCPYMALSKFLKWQYQLPEISGPIKDIKTFRNTSPAILESVVLFVWKCQLQNLTVFYLFYYSEQEGGAPYRCRPN